MYNIKLYKFRYLAEAIYAIYMYNYFKTTLHIHHPLEYYFFGEISDFFKHPINSSKYESKICGFGNISGFIFGAYLASKLFINQNNKLNNIIIGSVFIGSLLMNLNAFVYYLPIFIFELFY